MKRSQYVIDKCSRCGTETYTKNITDGLCHDCVVIEYAQRLFDEVCTDDSCDCCSDKGTIRCPKTEGRKRPEDVMDAIIYLGEEELEFLHNRSRISDEYFDHVKKYFFGRVLNVSIQQI